MRKLAMLRAAVIGLAMTMAVPWVAVADQYSVDGDLLRTGNQNDVAVTLRPGQSTTIATLVSVAYHGQKHVVANSTFTLGFDAGASTVPAGGTLTGTGAVATVPSPWATGGSFVMPVSATVTAPASDGTYSFTAKWAGSYTCEAGTNPAGGCVTGNATLNVTVTVDGTAPVVTVPANISVPATSAAGAVVTYSASAIDNVGTPTLVCSPASGSMFAAASTTTVSCTATDSAGNQTTRTFTVTVGSSDTTPPNVTANVSPAANVDGWNNTDVTVTWSVTDAGSAITSTTGCGAVTVSASTTITCSATSGGGTTSASVSLSIDKGAPTVAPAAKNADGSTYTQGTWTNQDVTVTFTCSDSLSGCTASREEHAVTAEGSATVGSSVFSDLAGNTASASYTVQIDKTAPTISAAATSSPNGNGWYDADVVIVFTCADQGGSGIVSCPASETLSATGASTATTVSDNAGNTSAQSDVISVRIDKVDPTIVAAATSSPNANGWYSADVTVAYTCDDQGGSGLAAACPTMEVLSVEGTSSTTARSISDNAGNSATSGVVTASIDKTAPTITFTATGTAGTNGWYTTDVTIHFVCADALSGIDTCTGDTVLSAEGAVGTATGTARDAAGNRSSTAATGIKIDKTAPVIAITGAGGVFALGSAPGATCSDATSGVASGPTWGAPVGGDANGFGTITRTVQCVDSAGVTASQTVTYTVSIEQSLTCFVSPIKLDQTYSAKSGSTIPMKCVLTAVLPRPDLVQLNVVVTGPNGAIAAIDSGSANGNGTLMRYSASLPGYVYNWQTTDSNTRTAKALPLGTYAFQVTVGSAPLAFKATVTLTR